VSGGRVCVGAICLMEALFLEFVFKEIFFDLLAFGQRLKASWKTLQNFNRFPFSLKLLVEGAIEDENKHGNGMENPSGQFSLLKQFV
jgi:hypothetical protein